jgi:UDP-N-acetylglucosamine diphosphorylase / glucose-1-phosphate thymidylyltransferase / UDP-N-acetylgalactosamine diphosphorylase / glucosamine-1-phosphate N-acetyltransferase / galactosamine-1-phosphate N-acetyltransferase
MKKQFTAILLAAGESSRFWPLASDKHKAMYEILGKPIISHTIIGLKSVGVNEIVIVKSPNDKSIEAQLGNGESLGVNIQYLNQNEPLGMGNAIQQTEKLIKTEYFFVLNADQVNADDLAEKMIEMLTNRKDIDSVLASQETKTPWDFGILEIDNNDIALSIEEKPEKGTENSNQMVIGIYLLAKRFFETLNSVETSQYSYEEALGIYMDKFKSTAVSRFKDIPEITLKFPWHLFRLNKYLTNKFMKNQFISTNAQISHTAVITGNVVIEDNVRVFEYAVIKGPCYICEGAIIGNNSLVRDYSYIGKGAIVGFGTEIKHSILYKNVETHKNFVGDSIIDEDSGLGAGTITANRRLDRQNINTKVKGKTVDTGSTFFGNIIGKNVHTGIQVGLMPGVKIGSNADIGALTNIAKDVADGHFAYNRQNVNSIKLPK